MESVDASVDLSPLKADRSFDQSIERYLTHGYGIFF